MVLNIGDLSSSNRLMRDVSRAKENLDRYAAELSSGVSSNLTSKLKGDFSPLAGIENGLARAESYMSTIEEYRLLVEAQQSVIQNIRDIADVSDTLLTLTETTDSTLLATAGNDAVARFSAVVGALNTQVGGRTVFAGIDTNRPALADAEVILQAIENELALAAATTASDVDTIVSGWFDTGGGFETLGYQGGSQASYQIRLSDNESGTPLQTAQSYAIRDQLAGLAKAALIGRDILSGNLEERGNLARISGENLIASDDNLVRLQASIGTTEAQIQRATVEVESQSESLEITRASIVETDPYEVAIKLQNSEVQLQTIYTLTSRLSNLSLVNFI